MPLPQTPDPEESNLYRQLSSEQLGSVDKDNFDIVQDSVFIDSANEDELRRINLVGQATNMQSQSGPIPGTYQIIQKSGTSVIVILEPGDGEVWQLQSLAVSTLAGSGINFRLNDGTTNMLLATASGSGVVAAVPDAPIYITKPAKIDCAVQGSSGTNIVQGAFIRVR